MDNPGNPVFAICGDLASKYLATAMSMAVDHLSRVRKTIYAISQSQGLE